MQDAMEAYEAWADISENERTSDFQAYAYNIAEARYVTRRVTRIINEQAKKAGLDPLLHQALLQALGTPRGDELAVGALADRLDIAAAFASRLVTRLEKMGLIRREPSTHDRRATNVTVTDEGVQKLKEIDDAIHYHIAYFQQQLEDGQRRAALLIYAFYVGIDSSSPIAAAIRTSGSYRSTSADDLK